MGNSLKNESRPPRRLEIGDWHIPGTAVRNAKCYNLSADVVMKSAAVLCMCWRSKVHSAISPAEKYYPFDPFAHISLRGALCCFLPRYMRFFAKHPKTRHKQGWKRLNFWPEKNKTPFIEMQLTKAQKKYFEPGRLNVVFSRGRVDPSYPCFLFLF